MLDGLGPSPETRFPLPDIRRLGFLKHFITRPTVVVGDYTYYDDPRGPEHFEEHVLYHFDFIGDRLIIGRYCSIAAETTFIMNGGNHATTWLTTYPFPIFGNGWEAADPITWPNRGDTRVGNDVRLGYRTTIMPGVTIGDGAIVASAAVVTRNVAPYAIVGGNPAAVIRSRFDPATIERMLAIAWWDWDAEKVTRNVRVICSGDVRALERAN
ncbi:MAG TPA: CatB-related O-acetyltransferase [Gemmatimonadaceae bacterium]|nr:CatB-related O-acetyltransferase [Gemmatimonadaceae bacterium]